MTKRPSKRPSAPASFGDSGKGDIPPPPDTRPEGLGFVISPGEPEPGGAEDYYKLIHGHRTVLAMKAVRPDAPPEGMAVLVEDARAEPDAPSPGAQALLQRLFASEKEVADLRERLSEALHERDAARGEVVTLRAWRAAVEALVARR